jgi:hypothetical protein
MSTHVHAFPPKQRQLPAPAVIRYEYNILIMQVVMGGTWSACARSVCAPAHPCKVFGVWVLCAVMTRCCDGAMGVHKECCLMWWKVRSVVYL